MAFIRTPLSRRSGPGKAVVKGPERPGRSTVAEAQGRPGEGGLERLGVRVTRKKRPGKLVAWACEGGTELLSYGASLICGPEKDPLIEGFARVWQEGRQAGSRVSSAGHRHDEGHEDDHRDKRDGRKVDKSGFVLERHLSAPFGG